MFKQIRENMQKWRAKIATFAVIFTAIIAGFAGLGTNIKSILEVFGFKSGEITISFRLHIISYSTEVSKSESIDIMAIVDKKGSGSAKNCGFVVWVNGYEQELEQLPAFKQPMLFPAGTVTREVWLSFKRPKFMMPPYRGQISIICENVASGVTDFEL